jgi:hypothetical protein
MDWVRAINHTFMVKTGLADTYRNEQFFLKLDFFYNFERNMIAVILETLKNQRSQKM